LFKQEHCLLCIRAYVGNLPRTDGDLAYMRGTGKRRYVENMASAFSTPLKFFQLQSSQQNEHGVDER